MSNGFPLFTAPPDPASFTGTIQAQDLDFKLGRVQQFNVNVEQQLPGHIVLTAGYAGSRSDHILIDGNNMNVSSPTACGTVAGYTLGCGPNGSAFGVPYTAFPFSTISNISDIGKAHYNSLQIKAETKSDQYGVYALIGYTYARAYDNGFTDGLGSLLGATYYPLPGWGKLDWGLSQINLNNSFTASVIYQLPLGRGKRFGASVNSAVNQIIGGWELTVIEKATSGFPVFVVDSTNESGVNFENNGNSLNRPNQTCSPTSGTSTLGQFFKTSCFAAPPSGELGNASRTPLSGPDFINTDFSAIKHFLLPREGMRLDFRAEFFNLFNHAQFGTPGGDINSATFGVVNTTVGQSPCDSVCAQAGFLVLQGRTAAGFALLPRGTGFGFPFPRRKPGHRAGSVSDQFFTYRNAGANRIPNSAFTGMRTIPTVSTPRRAVTLIDMSRFHKCCLAVALLLAAGSFAGAQPRRKVIINEDASGPGGSNMQDASSHAPVSASGGARNHHVSGDQWRDEELAHTLRLLEIIGRTDIPVMSGAAFPLLRNRDETKLWQALYGKVEYAGAWDDRWWHEPFIVPPLAEGQPKTKPAGENAINFLVRMVHQYPGEVTIYEGGPMTNLALAISLDPHFAELARELVFMGGSLNPDTDYPEFSENPRHEFNFWFDPEAAEIVLRAPWKRIVCTPTDISIKARLSPELVKQIGTKQRSGGAICAAFLSAGSR